MGINHMPALAFPCPRAAGTIAPYPKTQGDSIMAKMKAAMAAVLVMEKEGVTNILHMHEGITAWQKAGLPLEK